MVCDALYWPPRASAYIWCTQAHSGTHRKKKKISEKRQIPRNEKISSEFGGEEKVSGQHNREAQAKQMSSLQTTVGKALLQSDKNCRFGHINQCKIPTYFQKAKILKATLDRA